MKSIERALVNTGRVALVVGGTALATVFGLWGGAELGMAMSPAIHEMSLMPAIPPVNVVEGFGSGAFGLLGGFLGYLSLRSLLPRTNKA